ncbi:hypothetical protein VOLCADRAFT_103349 [Volvox carteri f. nagariensis]|uniref:Uncharacterized protein n=1 Tax=Volvox carteri f. nagariensis TaxID=3068 RepID=D8TLD8_VOLCA|nr:uncharacterized protein VOLCADRAFT_103349 [Volvox carteri f. nagariensis]EFJ51717.1 hypothetical protein VOLCADRAFT_103349 [Volvox carteri f. nagariensis]|eukprot:XP_002947127.1 hypothetical protein VOLCADRAFT_103349 [Volvox carteri f. nagariensis]
MRASLMTPCVARSTGVTQPRPIQAPNVNRGAPRGVACSATTAWDSWTSYISKHRADSASAPASKSELDYGREIAAAIRSSAGSFKSKYATGETNVPSSGGAAGISDFKLSHVGDINLNELPRDLHERLEALASVQLKQALGKPNADLDAASISFTTTDVDAALCVSGVTLQQGLDKTALIAFVATETERQASWSRLEGLILHWGATDAAGGAWGLPPQGWAASPNKVVDAGGAWQCSFEKQQMSGPEGNSAVYVLLLQVPLRGILKAGGLVFVLKATAGQNTRWLKDEATKKDFFLDTTRFPVIKASHQYGQPPPAAARYYIQHMQGRTCEMGEGNYSDSGYNDNPKQARELYLVAAAVVEDLTIKDQRGGVAG